MECQMCGAEMADSKNDMCPACQQEWEWDKEEIDRIQNEGHTYRCACRQVWGDGECECGERITALKDSLHPFKVEG